MTQQGALAGGPDAGQLVEHRAGHGLVPAAAVVGDREAMRLVADALQQLQLGGGVVEHQRRAAAGDEDLLDPLGQRDHAHALLAKAAQHRQPGAQLALAAVDHDQVGERREARVVGGIVGRDLELPLPLGIAPREHLRHRRVVVGGARRGADREAPVVGLLRRGALEHDHRGDRVGAAEVGDVEALDPDRGGVQAESLLQALERLHPRLATALGFQPLLVEGQLGVALGELEDAPLLTALGDPHLQGPVAAAGEGLARGPRARPAPAAAPAAPGSRPRRRSTGA